jgi:hypothetical protein
MTEPTIGPVVDAFFPGTKKFIAEPVASGHIHHTCVLKVFGRSEKYILQRINKQVFREPDLLIDNHIRLNRHFEQMKDQPFQIPALFPPAHSTGPYLYSDKNGEVWRLMEHIAGSYSIDKLESVDMATEAGKAYGWFIRSTQSLSPEVFTPVIPRFHDLRFRLEQLRDAKENNRVKRKNSCQDLIDFFKDREAQLLEFHERTETGLIPVRLTHNDTKINNVLFRKSSAVAVIDLDTVGPGIVHYDYGDSLRTLANRCAEDEKDPDKAGLNQQAFIAFTRGYLSETAPMLTEPERETLYLAPRLMTFIIGIRFLTDYLNGDVYFKTTNPDHNLIRTRVQKNLFLSMENAEPFMKETIRSLTFQHLSQ